MSEEIKKDKKQVAEHIQEDTIIEYAFYPEHEERKESSTFKKTKERLKKDGHYECWICGSKEKLEDHHLFEWAFWEDMNPEKVKEALKILDFYGYSNSEEFKDKEINTPDDIRNQLVLCENHHRHKLTGIHHLSFPLFLSQKGVQDGKETVPQNEDDIVKEEQKLGIKLGTYDSENKNK